MIERKPLRTQVQQEILARIADHRLPAGTRINESHLAIDLGVSRTPLREAMLGLEAVGFLGSDLGRGFMVPPISRDEFSQTQAMLSKMAPYALDLAQPLPGGLIMELNNLLGRSRIRVSQPGEQRPGAMADLICRWSALCISRCANKMLVADINRLEALSRRCWQEAISLGFEPEAMLAGYEEIYELLRTNHPAEAVVHWENHITRFAAEAARHLPTPPQATTGNLRQP